MLRQSDIAAAFRESILRSSKGFQYLHTRDFVTALRRSGRRQAERGFRVPLIRAEPEKQLPGFFAVSCSGRTD